MQTQSVKLPVLIENIKAGRYEIPQFQRNFVWRDAQVKLVIDSIARGYPIGSFLLMNQGEQEELKLSSRPIEASISFSGEENGSINTNDKQYVLDGQQRMTSITRVFLDGNSKKVYYFDLYEIALTMDEENQKWIKTRMRGTVPPKDRLDNNRLLRADIVLDANKAMVFIQEYVEDSEDFPELDRNQKRQMSAKIASIFEGIRNYDLSMVVMDGRQALDSICRVFETINSTGTRLTTFDLAVARFYPEPDLREMHERTLENRETLKKFSVEGERLLQVIHMMHSFKEGRSDVEPTRSALLKIPKSVVNSLWEQAAEGLSKAFLWASRNGVRPENLVGEHILTALGAVLALRPDALFKINLDLNLKLRQWFYGNALQPGARASNYVIGVQFNNLMRFIDSSGENPLTVNSVELNNDILMKLSSQDNRYRGIQSLMMLNAEEDLLTGAKLSDYDVEYHHIFPRSTSGISLKSLDNVLNFVIVSRETNRKLGSLAPVQYMSGLLDITISGQTNGALQDRLDKLMLPKLESATDLETYSLENFDSFRNMRANLVMHEVKKLMGDYLKPPISDNEEDL